MFKNYLTVAIRNLLKHKTYSLTNILGLTVGLTACICIFIWILDEVSFNTFHAKINAIQKIMVSDIYPDGKIDTYDAPTVKIGDALRKDVPEIEQVTQASRATEMLVNYDGKKFNETGLYADSLFFDIFSFPVTQGDPKSPVPGTSSIAVSERLARKLFHNEEALGKTITLDNTKEFVVSGVFKDVPTNSSLQFDFIISFELWKKENPWSDHWLSGATQAFVTLKPHADFASADAKVRSLIKQNCSDCNREAFLFPFAKLYLHGKFENGKSSGGRLSQVNLFGFIAIIILAMACFNFTNLTTARASVRNKEIGVRKSIGASRLSIALQFVGESLLISFLSLVLALCLVSLLLPVLNGITGKFLHLDLTNPLLLGGIAGITILCGVLSGLYPALYLSAINTSAILKNSTPALKKGNFRKALVVTQFVVSLVLIIGSLVVYSQLHFILNKDLGFNRQNVIVLNQNEELSKNYHSFKNELLQIPAVNSVAFVGSNLFQVPITTTDPEWANKPAHSSILFKVLRCDEGFIPAMKVKLIAGRNFTGTRSDSANYIINTKAMLAMGLTMENVIGSRLDMWNGNGEIIGLTEDFVNGNLHQGTKPLILMYSTSIGSNYYIKTTGFADDIHTLATIRSVTKKYAPDYPFEFTLLNDDYTKEYKTEWVLGKLSVGFTLIAIILCCLGLLGLAAFAAEQRTKEIGIRKVLGASVSNITTLLSKDFIKLVLIAIVIACPIAYYAMNQWLQGFANKVDLGWWVFALAGLVAILIALLTVTTQAIKASLRNPVKSLRTE